MIEFDIENMSNEFIQSQIDYFDSLPRSGYHYGINYRDEKYRRKQIAKETKRLLCEGEI